MKRRFVNYGRPKPLTVTKCLSFVLRPVTSLKPGRVEEGDGQYDHSLKEKG